MTCLRFGVLGPLEVWRHERRVEVTAARQRTVLALLLLRAGQMVSTEQLVAAVWDEQPPATARRTVQSLVSRLRRTLACGPGEALTRQPNGYRLSVPPDRVDAYRFEELVAQAGEADRQGRVSDVAETLRRGLALWRGAALADVPRTSLIEAEAVQLEEQRQAAVDARLDADLRLGRHANLLAELHALTAARPLHERTWELLLLALYRSGRRADALESYQRVRAALSTELGVEPGPALQELHRRILAADPVLGLDPARAVPGSPAPPRARARTVADGAESARADGSGPARPGPPDQLPADVAGFAGRAEPLTDLDARLPDPREPDPVRILAIDGTAGVGKTALAVHWAHQVRDRFPDGQLYADLRGYASGPPVPPIEVLDRFLTALGTPASRVPSELDEAAAAFRSRLAGQRVLVLLDNAAGPSQVRPLLPGTAGLALVTSRDRLDWLVAQEGAHRLCLDVLPPEEARQLLAHLLGAERVAAELDAAAELAELCGHLPLALRIAVASRPAYPPSRVIDLVARLRRLGRGAALTVAGDSHASVAGTFALSYGRLPGPARQLFRLLGLVPGPDVTVEAAASLAGVPPAEAGARLRALAQAHLVEERAPDRFGCHDLLRWYATDRGRAETSEADRGAALERLYRYYHHGADAATRVLFPHRLRPPEPEPAGAPAVPISFPDPAAALAWLDAERANLATAAQDAAARGYHRWAWTLADDVRHYCYFGLRVPAGQWAGTARAGLAAAEAAGDQLAQVAGHLGLATLRWRQARYRAAAGHGEAAYRLARHTGWVEGQAAALFQLAAGQARTGDFAGALAQFQQGLGLAEQVQWRHGQAVALTNLGSLYLEMGWPFWAARPARRGLAITADLGTRYGEVVNLVNLGAAHYLTGRFDLAASVLRQARSLSELIGSSSGLATAQRWLAILALAAGHHHRAAELATAAVALARDCGLGQFEVDALVVLATIHHQRGRPRQALRDGRRALSLAEQGGGPLAPVEAWIELACAYLQLDELEAAHRHVVWALATAREMQLRLLEARALTALAQVRLAGGEPSLAIASGEQALALHRAVGHRLGQGHTHLVLGQAWRQAGDQTAARRHRRTGGAVLAEIGAAVSGTPLRIG